jgi:hypothetical protein
MPFRVPRQANQLMRCSKVRSPHTPFHRKAVSLLIAGFVPVLLGLQVLQMRLGRDNCETFIWTWSQAKIQIGKARCAVS